MNLSDVIPTAAFRKTAPKAGEQIAAVLRSEIVSGAVKDGERLGSGNELLERFGVSRPTLREAFRILEAESMIRIERGTYGGVIACHPDERYTVRAMTTVLESRGVTFSDVYEARTMIESTAARRLAEAKGRKAVVNRLRIVVTREEAALHDPLVYASANIEFHEQLVAASSNQTLMLLAEVLHDIVEPEVTRLTEKDKSAAGMKRRRMGIRAQNHLLDLIAEGRAGEAEGYWRRHMQIVGSIMLAGEVLAVVSHVHDSRR
jgi:GntR family transcriptional repressor for pyruvate dehydrogenase complex